MNDTYMNGTKYAIIDCRVSDQQQLKGGSLDDQEALGRVTAERLGASVVKVFRSPHSGTTTERDDLEEKIQFIKSCEKPIHFYIFKCIDRFTRAGFSEYEKLKTTLEKLGVQLIDSYGVIRPRQNTLAHLGQAYKWSEYSPSESAEMLAAFQGKQEVRDILTRLIGAEIRLVQEGYAVRSAPDGFRNKKIVVEGKDKVIREPSDRAKFYKAMFELREMGVNDEEIVKRVNEMGFSSKVFKRWDRSDKENPKVIGDRGGNPLTVKQLQRYIMRTEYAGVIYEKWTKEKPVKAQWDGIVSIATFNKANRGKIYIEEMSDGYIQIHHEYSPWANKRRKDNPAFPWKCIRCTECQLSLLGSSSKGKSGKRYAYYHCGSDKRGIRSHSYIKIPKQELEQNISDYLNRISVNEEYLPALELHLFDVFEKNQNLLKQEEILKRKNIEDIEAVIAKKVEAFTYAENNITRKILERQIEGLEKELKILNSEIPYFEFNKETFQAFNGLAQKLLEQPEKTVVNIKDATKKQAYLELLFDEIPTYEQILTGTPKVSLFFKDYALFSNDKSQWVNQLSLNWNSYEATIAQWHKVIQAFGLPPPGQSG